MLKKNDGFVKAPDWGRDLYNPVPDYMKHNHGKLFSHHWAGLPLSLCPDLIEQFTLQMIKTLMAEAAFNMMKVIRRISEFVLRILNELFRKTDPEISDSHKILPNLIFKDQLTMILHLLIDFIAYFDAEVNGSW